MPVPSHWFGGQSDRGCVTHHHHHPNIEASISTLRPSTHTSTHTHTAHALQARKKVSSASGVPAAILHKHTHHPTVHTHQRPRHSPRLLLRASIPPTDHADCARRPIASTSPASALPSIGPSQPENTFPVQLTTPAGCLPSRPAPDRSRVVAFNVPPMNPSEGRFEREREG